MMDGGVESAGKRQLIVSLTAQRSLQEELNEAVKDGKAYPGSDLGVRPRAI